MTDPKKVTLNDLIKEAEERERKQRLEVNRNRAQPTTPIEAQNKITEIQVEQGNKRSISGLRNLKKTINKTRDPSILAKVDEYVEDAGGLLKDTGKTAMGYFDKAYKATSLRPLVEKALGEKNVKAISKEYSDNPYLHTAPTEALRGVGTLAGAALTGVGAIGNVGRMLWNKAAGDEEDYEDAKRKLLKLGTTDVLGKDAFTPLSQLPKESRERWVEASKQLIADTATHPLTYLSAGGGAGAKTFQTQAAKLGAKLPEAQKAKFLKEANKLYAAHAGKPIFIKGMEGLTRKFGLSAPETILGQGSKYAGREGIKLLGKEIIPRKSLEVITTPVEKGIAISKNVLGHPAHENPHIQQAIRDSLRRFRLSPEIETKKDLAFLHKEFKQLGKDVSEKDLAEYYKLSDPGYDITKKAIIGSKPFLLDKNKQLKPFTGQRVREGESLVHVKPNSPTSANNPALDKFFKMKGQKLRESGAIEGLNPNPVGSYVNRIQPEEVKQGLFPGLKLPGGRKGLGPDIKHRTEYGGMPYGGNVTLDGKVVQEAIGTPDDIYKVLNNYIKNSNKASAKQTFLKEINSLAKQLNDPTLAEDLAKYAEKMNVTKDKSALGKVWDWSVNRSRKAALQNPGYNIPNIIGDSLMAAPSFGKGNLVKVKQAMAKLGDAKIPDTAVLFKHPTTGEVFTKAKVRKLYERHMVDTLSGDPNQFLPTGTGPKDLRTLIGGASGDKLAPLKHNKLKTAGEVMDTTFSLGANKANQKVSEVWNQGLQKAKFIDNLMKGESGVRAAQDVFGAVMDYGAPNTLIESAKRYAAFPAYPLMATGMLPVQLAKSPNTMLAPYRLSKGLSTNEEATADRLPMRTKQGGNFITPKPGDPLDVGMNYAMGGLTSSNTEGEKTLPIRDTLSEVTAQLISGATGDFKEQRSQLTPSIRRVAEGLAGIDTLGRPEKREQTLKLFKEGDALGEYLKKQYGLDVVTNAAEVPVAGDIISEWLPRGSRALLNELGMKLGWETRGKAGADQAGKDLGILTGHPVRYLGPKGVGVQLDPLKLERAKMLLPNKKKESPKLRKAKKKLEELDKK